MESDEREENDVEDRQLAGMWLVNVLKTWEEMEFSGEASCLCTQSSIVIKTPTYDQQSYRVNVVIA